MLITNLIRTFRARVETRDWMEPETRAEALRKLDFLVVLVGYPDTPQRDYSQLIVKDDDLVGNVQRAAKLDWQFYLSRLSKPVDRKKWYFKPHVNNAANATYLRSMVFPAALLQAPMYDSKADPAINYGAFGAYAGHEITHTLDDQGRKVDASGRLRNWWTAGEAKTFVERTVELGQPILCL